MANSKRTNVRYETTVLRAGYYFVSGAFYAFTAGKSATIKINNVLKSVAYGSDNVEMPVNFCGYLDATTKIQVESNGTDGGFDDATGKNFVSILCLGSS